MAEYQLTQKIIELSESDYWETARREWVFEMIYVSEEPQTCLCGHFPIINICVIRNTKNENNTEVGNCCINKFLGINDGNKILPSINRLKEDLSKSMSLESLDYLYDKNVISQKEYDFYSDIQRKRNLSLKQSSFKESINEKLLNFTSYEANSIFAKINKILKWAENRDDFDTDFVESLKHNCQRKGTLTNNQKLALDKIIKKFKIE
ncbi:MAG TPA: hypothetical protein DDZ96_14915 [Porphyromonadaceae bacterium]|jgi:Asp-tRNA(Asn)/Glu-tRNA(Gln) amidotransferase C subunit|nr:hypothetical protein [Porphyromonadaceae bacterium]HBX19268.1 hypothetical protein [Porphyromonadaceae bacterium]HCM20457.1 hypothetical protein [Porphyromonadaceae bacterium]